MRNDVALDRASIIALVLETYNFGLFTALFGATLQFALKKRITKANGLFLPVLCLIWVLSMAHWIIDICRAVTAFVDTPAGALVYYEDVSNPLETAKTAIYVTITLTGDFIMIFRCFVVWNRKWAIVAFPIILWLGTGVVGYRATHALLLTRKGGVFIQALAPWITSFFSMSLSLNIICTSLIAYRILRTRMALHKHNAQHSRVYSALIIFLESAAIYSTSLLVLLYILIDVGITFSMILLRLAMANPKNESLASVRSRANSYPLTSVTVSRLVEVSGVESFEHPSGKNSTLDPHESV
ncbi:hypothetical protein C8J57DRAFT_1340351 [Mycena rebaudengoi]|nr:hypothetical protein C8J57DRAFT_1340351 [Mycena rebaudengoi]